jgi:hypothetical protein
MYQLIAKLIPHSYDALVGRKPTMRDHPMANAEDKKILPPYASHKAFERLLDSFRGDGHLPDQVDRGVLGTMSGSGQSSMLKTLEALGLIDGASKPTRTLRDLLTHAKGSAEFKAKLREILERAYPYLFGSGINLKTATTNQVQGAFREQNVTGSTISKCIAFFLSAAKDAGVEISKYVRTPPMADVGSKKRSTSPRNVAPDDDDEAEEAIPTANRLIDDIHPALAGLLATLPAPGQPMSEKARVRFLAAFEAVLSFAHPDEEAGG